MSGEKASEAPMTELPSPHANSNSAEELPRVSKSPSYFDEWCQVTGWHGVIDYQLSKSYASRILWLCAIGVSAFMALNQTISLIMDYCLDEQWVTSVIHETPPGGSLPWPNMSLCSLDMFDEARFRGRDRRDPYMIAYIAQAGKDGIKFYDQYQAETPRFGDNQAVLEELMQNLTFKYEEHIRTRGKTFREVMEMYVRNCTDTVLHCGHSQYFQLHKPAENCCDSSRPTVMVHSGLNTKTYASSWSECFTVVPGRALGRSEDSGEPEGGIYYLLNPRTQDYYTNILDNTKPSAGFRLHLYMNEENESEKSTLMLAPGTHAVISMVPEKYVTRFRKLRTVQLYKPANDVCVNETDYQYLQSMSGIYSKRYCQRDCRAAWSMHNCGCVMMDATLKRGHQCMGKNFSDCYAKWGDQDRHDHNNSKSSAFNLTDCNQKCKHPCETSFITTKLSTAKFPAEVKLAAFATYMNRAYPDRSPAFTQKELEQLILLEMFYEAKDYRVTERYQRISVDEFLSSIGGTLGVWMGISLLSIFQGVVYLIKAIGRRTNARANLAKLLKNAKGTIRRWQNNKK